MIIDSLRPVSMLNDSAQRKTNPKSEMTHCIRTLQPYSIHYIFTVYTIHEVTHSPVFVKRKQDFAQYEK